MEVKINSEELIKPSSPTPQHLRAFKLSLLDHLIQVPFTPVIFFYPSNSEQAGPCLDVPQKLDLLKKSLSRTLTQLYPLAGKIRDDGLYIDCNDGGARFVEASVNMSLTQFLTDPDLVLLNKLLPNDEFLIGEFPELTHPVNIQVNVFRCGGIALGICNSHRLHDGTSEGVFLKEWAAIARGSGGGSGSSGLAARDLMVAAELFPANDLWLRDSSKIMFNSMCKPGNSVTKRFTFTGPAIEALRTRGKGPSAKNPTRVEAVTGLLWKCAMAALERKNNGLRRPSVFTHLVDIRNRMNPPLSGPLGNFLWLAAAHYMGTTKSHDGTEDVLPSLVGELRGAISKVDGEFVSGLRQDKSLISSSLEKVLGVGLSEYGHGVDHFVCSSWCSFRFYDIDFGWGRPVWVSNIGLCKPMFLNLIFLVDTRSGDGIEAWVTMDDQEMALLQEDPELRAFANVNPSPLTISSKL
ncbi:stemmadenine O-acetyltransferase-like [Punica granatum]|uniref:Stemmadenine O-acetyltransferase-like n=1 Tax=Punica granatum TaxID=22663 RepID=A0A6P8EM87_PUNGR|nr:stemmadenine O-acetyltransferase-like [Punica granatum]